LRVRYPGDSGVLVNKAMPLIRYDQGDTVVKGEPDELCSCSSHFSTVKVFGGRRNDSFILRSGEEIPSGILLDLGYSTFLDFSEENRYWSMVQEDYDHVYFDCVLVCENAPGLKESIEASLEVALQGRFKVELRIVDEIPRSKVGKIRQIVSRVPRG
jgi:phenylacetate-coenzyme A ligase PaaK-like adenylate-forming protein